MAPKFVSRVRKQKAKARLASEAPPAADSNATEIIPSEQEKRKAQLRDELKSKHTGQPMSSKKKKRLDHYIDTKLRKEENAELIKKLASHKVDTSLLRSSKNLGRGQDTKRETLTRALQETQQGINEKKNAAVLFERRPAPVVEESDEEVGEQATEPATTSTATTTPAVAPATAPATTFGSGLKRPLELGQNGLPQIKTRKRRKVAERVPSPPLESFDSDDDKSGSDAWHGFSGDEEEEDGSSASEEEQENSDEDEEGSESDSDDEDEEDEASDKKQRSSAFKEWAEQRRNESVGFVPTRIDNTAPMTTTSVASKPRQSISAPVLGPLVTAEPSKRAVSIVVPRTDTIQEARLNLPVVQEEQKIIETILANKITVVCGATGSGKTTQVPQMLFENGFGCSIGGPAAEGADKRSRGMIGVTQPRRVAATSVADRVATEMGTMRNRVGHQVRFDSAVGPKTAIKFMTDGILLREIAHEFTLSKYSAIVIDEAHERSVNTDILIGLLSRIVDLREDLAKEQPDKYYPLKLVIMSATMRVEDFTGNTRLFKAGPPPLVQAEGRQFPVVNHFARQTHRDYVEEMFKKVCKGHKKLPRGGMLVFLTGQAEIVDLMKRLQEAFPSNNTKVALTTKQTSMQDMDCDDWQASRHKLEGEDEDDDYIQGLSDEEDEEFEIEQEEQDREDIARGAKELTKIHVLPLYSQLPAEQQAKIFKPVPEDSRLIVISTNVAETSLTIPGIRYVFDCGRAKERQYDTRTGIQTFDISWISRASAAQRSGRAGRTGPGHCYRLYSSAVFERDFAEYTIPEILRSPVEQVALTVKSVDFPNVANFPFPTAPDRHALARAEELLGHLGAIDKAGKITTTGRAMMDYPLNPRHSRMLLLAAQHKLLPPTIALVSALSIPELLLTEQQALATTPSDVDREDNPTLKAYRDAQSILSQWDAHCDAFKLLAAFGATSIPSQLSERCKTFFIREKGMQEAHSLSSQLLSLLSRRYPELSPSCLSPLPRVADKDLAKLKFVLAAGFSDCIAAREDVLGIVGEGRAPRRGMEVAYRTLSGAGDEKGRVFVHPGSVLAQLGPGQMPAYIVYSHLSRAAAKLVGADAGPRVRMHPLTPVGEKQVAALLEGTSRLEVGKPIGNITNLPSEGGKMRREVWVGVSVRAGQGDGTSRWELGQRKERQKKVGGEWKTESVLG